MNETYTMAEEGHVDVERVHRWLQRIVKDLE